MSPSCSVSTFRREARQGTYVLHFAYSGEEALDKLAAGIEPQLIVILSDINMPVMDGLELLREIKARRPDLPVIPASRVTNIGIYNVSNYTTMIAHDSASLITGMLMSARITISCGSMLGQSLSSASSPE